ncbi:MAG: hypothetical protein IJ571_10645 [Ruminococcus sp.]|nr:hypothetical protein [Ruminococcus sp.]
MKRKESFRENWQTMPDQDLKRIYNSRKSSRMFYASITLVVLFFVALGYGFMGWVSFLGSLYVQFRQVSNETAGIIYYAAFFAAGCLISIADSKTLWHILLPVPISAVLVFVIFWYFSAEALVLEFLLAVFYLRLRVLVRDIDFLKRLPSYPFEGHRDYSRMNAMSQKEQLKQLEIALNGARSTGYEHIFTDSKEELEKPKTDDNKEEHFQQHKMWYGER